MRERIERAFTGSGIDPDILEELAQHAEATYAALVADGVSDADARARVDALVAGWRADPAALRRGVRRPPAAPPPPPARALAAGALADAWYAVRLWKAQPGAALVTILTIALGVGAVTTLFSVAYGVLLRPLPWGDIERVVRLTETRGGREARMPGTMMNGSYLAWADAPQTLDAIGYYSGDTPATLTGAGEAARLAVSRVTPATIELLGVAPVRGRLFAAADGRSGSDQPSVALIAYALWEQRFGLRDDIIGQPLVIDGVPHTIVGVMPRVFQFPSAAARAWIAWQAPPVDGPGGTKTGTIMRAIGRLKPGVTPAQAAAEGTARAVAAPDAGPVAMALFGAKEPIQITVNDITDAVTAEVRPAIVILLIASALLFVTAIANVANMQLARAMARQRELTIRAALGAGSGRLARQLLIENGLAGVLGAAGGLLLTLALHAAMPSLLPAGFPRADAIMVDGRVLGFTVLLSLITTVVCGLLPLLHARRLDPARTLSAGSLASAGAGRGRVAAVRMLIVTSQVAVTCVLVVGAVLLSRSFLAHAGADRGYDPANVLTAAIPFPNDYSVERRVQALDRMVARLAARPGVTHAAVSTGLPLASAGGFTFFRFPSPLRDGATIEVESIRRVVTPPYFGALGIRVRAGRPLTGADHPDAPPAVVVNRSFVRKYLDDIPIEQAVGLSLGLAAVSGTTIAAPATIVGVVDDVLQGQVAGTPQPEMFVSLDQLRGVNHGSQAYVVLRTAGDPVDYVPALRTALRDEDPALALEAVMTMDERVGASLAQPRMYATLLAGFAAFALLIAAVGLFGVLSHSVAQRSRELAVRTALGASRAVVVGVAVKQIAAALVAGLALGLVAAAALSNTLAPYLYGVPARDWLSFGAAPVVLLAAGLAAAVAPARRVARTDPLAVLREG